MEADKELLEKFIKDALKEDVGDGDHTSLSTIPEGMQGSARLLIKEDGVVAGVDVAVQIFKHVDSQLEVETYLEDGAEVQAGDIVLQVSGSSYSILVAERLERHCNHHASYCKFVEGYRNKGVRYPENNSKHAFP
jgi:nicotinate-nucleotide pyrophosphorylase (carboxylating)